MISGDGEDAPLFVFDRPLVVVGGGWVDEDLLSHMHGQGAGVVAADGALHACLAAGVTPDAVIGDMDSIGEIADLKGDLNVIEIGEQDTTDFEKCLYSTRAPVTLALGVTGKRLDHTLAALDTVARHAGERHIIVVDETDIALGVQGAFAFEVGKGERVSVHPLQKVRFARSRGLKYRLDGLTLAPGLRTGTSNEAIEGAFEIVPETGEDGSWLLIVGREHLGRLLEEFENEIAP